MKSTLGIGLFGADGVGKTTLLSRLHEHYGDRITIIREVARKVIERGFPLGKSASAESYIVLISEQMKAEMSAISAGKPFISDRTLFDAFCYGVVNKELIKSTVPDTSIELNRISWLRSLSDYELFIHVPIEFDIVNDGVRENDAHYQRAIDSMFLSLAKDTGIRFASVSGNMDQRFQQAVVMIDGIVV